MNVLDYCPRTGVFTWKVSPGPTDVAGNVAGHLNDEGYIIISIGYKNYKAHRLAWLCTYGELPSSMLDHINGNRSDNRIENLRQVTNCVNQRNVVAANSNSKSGLRGAAWSKSVKKWRAQIKVNGKDVSLGYFDTKEEAHEAYMKAKRQHHPECKRAAFPELGEG